MFWQAACAAADHPLHTSAWQPCGAVQLPLCAPRCPACRRKMLSAAQQQQRAFSTAHVCCPCAPGACPCCFAVLLAHPAPHPPHPASTLQALSDFELDLLESLDWEVAGVLRRHGLLM